MVKTSDIIRDLVQSNRQKSNSIKYKGVRKRNWGKWVSEIRLPNSRERIWLGSYDNPEKAARAFDAAQICLRGSKANLNFPDRPPDIAVARAMTPCEIQAAATRFANLAVTTQSCDTYQQNSFEVQAVAARFTNLAATTQSCDTYQQSSFEMHSDEVRLAHVATIAQNEIQIFESSYKIVESDILTESSMITHSPCISDVTVQNDSEAVGVVEESFYEQLSLSETLGSDNYVSKFGYFTGFDEFNGGEYNYMTLLQSENFDYNVEDTYDVSFYQDLCLWNF